MPTPERGLGRPLSELLPMLGEDDSLEALFGGSGFGPARSERSLAESTLDVLLAVFPGSLCGACWDGDGGPEIVLAGHRDEELERDFTQHLLIARRQPGLHRLRRPPAEVVVVPSTTLSLGARRLGWPFTDQECAFVKAVGRLLAVTLQG